MICIAIIAALDRELAPLVRGWQRSSFSHQGRVFRARESESVVAVASGIGAVAAAIAARAVAKRYHPEVMISAGVAGALHQDLHVGSIFVPHLITDSSTGAEYRAESGNGVLVTAAEIADSRSKQRLRENFRASAVDMEAAAVAEVARREQIEFRCVKAISDEFDFEMPPLNQFVDAELRFQSAKFALWTIFHPQHWLHTATLACNTRRATGALCSHLKNLLGKDFQSQTGAVADKNAKVLDI